MQLAAMSMDTTVSRRERKLRAAADLPNDLYDVSRVDGA